MRLQCIYNDSSEQKVMGITNFPVARWYVMVKNDDEVDEWLGMTNTIIEVCDDNILK